jgi:hypothetical protein
MNNNLLIELEKLIKRTKFWFLYYRFLGDWLNAISIIFSITIPFLLLLGQSIDPSLKKTLDYVTLIISLIALILTVINNVYKFKTGSFFHLSCLIDWEDLKRRYESNLIDDTGLIQEMKSISERSRTEIAP